MFGDLDMRSRMNRLGGFDWGGHKRRGSGAGFPDASNYDQFFQNDFQFPGFKSHLDAFNRAKPGGGQSDRPHPTVGSPSMDRSHFYSHVPEEFRHYFPESFGSSFSRMRPQQYQPQQQQPADVHQPQSPTQRTVPLHHQQSAAAAAAAQTMPAEYAARPTVCDAAIQTDMQPVEPASTNLNQHGLRNTVDMGQKSRPELSTVNDRAQSAPPSEPLTPISANKPGVDGSMSNTGTSMTPQSATDQQHNRFNYSHQSPAASSPFVDPQVPLAQQSPANATANRMRTVPIQVEGRPAAAAAAAAQRPPPAARPEPFTPKHEADVVDAADAAADAARTPPQTPHTTDCISKIQAIQTDVLELMGAVDRFSGRRGDKEYMFIDEMLTRNLLKLDTIDTNGRENIRLARKEAIRCIQASITVLEAKAEQNANKKHAVEHSVDEPAKPDEAAAAADVAASTTVVDPIRPDTANLEQSLEDRLADFQRKSEERDTPAADEASAASHVSEININLNGERA